jgi:hypothetical protein
VTIQDLGSIGELIAAVATIATLIYLARQLRANTAAVQGDSRRATRASSSASNLLIASDPAVAALFNTGLKDFGALSPDQRTQFAFLLAEQIGAWQGIHEEFESGLVELHIVDATGRAYVKFLLTPGGREWWATYRGSFAPSFVTYADTRVEEATNQRDAASGEVATPQAPEPDSE